MLHRIDVVPPRLLWPLLLTWTVVLIGANSVGIGTSWHYFDLGAHLLTGARPFHLYAQHPELQFGPLALLVALPFSALGPDPGRWGVCALMACTGPLLLWVASRLRPGTSTDTIALAGIPFLLVWTQLSVSAGHLDDVLALCLAVLAVRVVHRRPMLAAALLALAVDAKPWALAFGAILLAVPAGRRVAAVTLWAGIIAVAWLPFVLGDHTTLSALSHFSISNSPSSALRFFEVDTARTPTWDRAAQLLLGVVLGGLALRRRGAGAVLMVVMAGRLVLEPGTHTYYNGGLLAATLVWDLSVSRRSLPFATLAAFLLHYVPVNVRGLHLLDGAAGASRALLCLGLLLLALLPWGSREREADDPQTSDEHTARSARLAPRAAP